MARVLNPMMSQAAKGSVQGITFGGNRSGPTVRTKAIPVRRVRSVQTGNRAILGYLATYWQSISAEARELWAQWAVDHPQPNGFGGTFVMSGFNAYISLNQCAMTVFIGQTVLDKPPVVPLAATPATLLESVAAVAGTIKIAFTLNGTGLADDYVEVWTSDYHVGAGSYDGLKGWKRAMSVAGTAVTATIVSLLPSAYYGVRIRYTGQDGQRSNWLQILAMAKATV